MNRFVTLTLVVLAALIVAFLVFVEPRLNSVRDRQMAAGYILDFNIPDIDGLILVNGSQTVELERRGQHWKLTEPIRDDASPEAVNRILNAAQNLRSIDRISANEIRKSDLHLKDFGLYSPKQWIDLKGDRNPRITFGKDAAGTNRIYVRVGDMEDVYVVPDTLRDLALSPVDSLRAQELSTLRLADIAAFSLRRPSGEIEVRRDGNGWALTKPLRAPADTGQVEKLLNGFLGAQISKFVPDGTSNLTNYGIIEGENELSLIRRGKEGAEKIRFGRIADDSKEQMYVQSVSRNVVAEAPSTVLELLAAATPENLRDRKLLRLHLDVVDRIRVQEGEERLLLLRDGDNWLAQDKDGKHPVSAKAVEAFVRQLEETNVASFHEATDADLALCGLNPPMASLTFTAWLSENTAEDDAGEKTIVTLDFGKSSTGRNFARRDHAPEALALNDDILALISTNPARWEKPPAPNIADPSQPESSPHKH